ncbi:MAG: DinB family protein [Gemmatimonadaceae bacterium]
MNRPKSDLEALRHDLNQLYDGSPWHGSSIKTVLEGIDADTAALRSIPHAHTIWELALHITSWTREVASRVAGGDAKDPVDWPEPQFRGGSAAWEVAKRDLAAAHTELEKEVARLEPDDLLRWVGDQRDPALGTGLPVGTVIRGLLQHDTYHQGQIAILRKAAETRR